MTVYLTISDVSAQTGLSEYQVREAHRSGTLPGNRIGRLLRFTEADIAEHTRRTREDKAKAESSGLTAGSRARRRSA